MDGKINLKVCVGTYCYVMGGNKLADIKHELPDDLRQIVYLQSSICLGCDSKVKNPKPPYVEIDGQLISEATTEKIISYLRNIKKTK